MSRTVVVRYETRAEAADESQRLVERVLTQLAAEDPGGLRYAAFRLTDGVTFVHLAVVEGETSRVSQFAEFQHGIGDRVVGPTGAGRRRTAWRLSLRDDPRLYTSSRRGAHQRPRAY